MQHLLTKGIYAIRIRTGRARKSYVRLGPAVFLSDEAPSCVGLATMSQSLSLRAGGAQHWLLQASWHAMAVALDPSWQRRARAGGNQVVDLLDSYAGGIQLGFQAHSSQAA